MAQELHVCIGTPMYGGMCAGTYTTSVMALKAKLNDLGHKCSTIFPGNESLIQRARNMIAWHFLANPDATHLLFIDADIVFRADDIVRMIEADKDIIVAPVPMKLLNWVRIAAATLSDVPAQDLHRYGGIFNIVYLTGPQVHSVDEPFEIKFGGAGVMLIKREVFDTLIEYDLVETYENQLPGGAMPPRAEVKNFFPVEVVDNDLLSEDYGLCHLWRDRAGGTIWAAPWCEIGHMGTYKFTGVYRDCYA